MTPTILVALMLTQTEAELSANIEARVRSATVRVVNRTKRTEGAGVVIGRTGPVVYVLTAAHLFEDGERVEAQSYSPDNSPKLTHDFKEVAVVSRKDPMKLDLAILRFAPGPGILETTLAIAGPKE